MGNKKKNKHASVNKIVVKNNLSNNQDATKKKGNKSILGKILKYLYVPMALSIFPIIHYYKNNIHITNNNYVYNIKNIVGTPTIDNQNHNPKFKSNLKGIRFERIGTYTKIHYDIDPKFKSKLKKRLRFDIRRLTYN